MSKSVKRVGQRKPAQNFLALRPKVNGFLEIAREVNASEVGVKRAIIGKSGNEDDGKYEIRKKKIYVFLLFWGVTGSYTGKGIKATHAHVNCDRKHSLVMDTQHRPYPEAHCFLRQNASNIWSNIFLR